MKEMEIEELLSDINETAGSNIEYAVPNFVTKIEKHFSDGGGFYYWNSIKYFLYEYEYKLSKKNNLDKVSWGMFTTVEKDKISIEHILPQTPTKYYWRNQFRQFDKEEIEMLSGALGNLLPLSQSINSSLQNDSFYDKKTSTALGRRGYENGSHSEIEVSKEAEWTAKKIYERSISLLQFMENRWKFSLTKEQMEKLVYVSFAIDGREVPEELPEEPKLPTKELTKQISVKQSEEGSAATGESELEKQRLKFWTGFVNYCKNNGYGDSIAKRKPSIDGWYTIPVGAADYHVEFSITRSRFLSLIIYVQNEDVFTRLENKKIEIESEFGNKFDWYSSREQSKAKRIVYKIECDIFSPAKQEEYYAWMVDKFAELKKALVSVGELD